MSKTRPVAKLEQSLSNHECDRYRPPGTNSLWTRVRQGVHIHLDATPPQTDKAPPIYIGSGEPQSRPQGWECFRGYHSGREVGPDLPR